MTANPRTQSEPVAIVGMSCRFPGGANSPEELWSILEKGVDTITEVPKDRWNVDDFYAPPPAKPGKMFTRSAAFLEDIDKFDAHFFGITPREANLMDPQQRLLLELSWEALENAGLAPDRMEGSDTGVFVGATSTDYMFLQVPVIEDFSGHAAFGSVHCIASGRLSFFYDFRGPNAAFDTACSSSLTAVHMAMQSLRAGECEAALAGGVSALLAPHVSVALCQWGALAPDGRCKPFSAAADGFGRGEGGGFVVLKRLDDAVASGDDILAVIRGTAMTQDGRGTRLSAPNAAAQVAVFRKALSDAGVDGTGVGLIEAHGTGTPIGDPIEVTALTEVYGRGRDGAGPCYLGSVKANIGHQEASAGIAGLIKAVLCLQNNQVPRQIHVDELNPALDLTGTPFVVPVENVEWPRTAAPRQAAVCSFGLSGTNVHVIVEDPPAPPHANRRPAAGAQLLPISARSGPALEDQIAEMARFLTDGRADEGSLADICYTASVRRSQHSHRAVVVGESAKELAAELEKLSQQERAPRPVESGLGERLAILFTGQGSKWRGLGRELLVAEPAFRRRVEECDRILTDLSGWSVLEELAAGPEQSRLGNTEVDQPAIFAIQVGLVALFEEWGVRPDAVVGHSSGEVAAAYCAGALSLEDACAVIHHRSRLMQRAAGGGRMAAIGLGESEARAAIEPFGGRLEVAAVNAPHLTTVTGEAAALDELIAHLKAQKIVSQPLDVDCAFHSRQMEPILDELQTALAGIAPLAGGEVRFVSTVTGGDLAAEALDAGYWVRNVRQEVQFACAVDGLLGEGYRTFLELGPHPALASPVSRCARERSVTVTTAASLTSGTDPAVSLRRAVGDLWLAGAEVDLAALHPDGGRPVRLPNYRWQKRSYWLPAVPNFADRAEAEVRSKPAEVEGDELDRASQIIGTFYDVLARTVDTDGAFGHLTYIPLPEVVPGFSWLKTFYEPTLHPESSEMVRRAHKQFRDVIFRGIDFSAIRSVMDFGCGYGTDLRNLASAHAHLTADGYTLSAKQADLGNQKAREADLADRVHIYRRDSGQEEFPGTYDLVVGFEVAHYIRDKHTLFANIDRHLNDGGFVVLADFISSTVSEIRHEPTNSFFPTVEGWAELLAAYKLRVHECVDASREMGNWLYDPESGQNLAELIERRGEGGGLREHFLSYDGLGALFRKQLAVYAMMTIQKDRFRTREEIARINRELLTHRAPYQAVAERMGLESVIAESADGDVLGDTAAWAYEIAWSTQPLPASGHQDTDAGVWLVLTDDKSVGTDVAAAMQARGLTPILVRAGTEYRPPGDSCALNPAEREHFDRIVAQVAPPGTDLRGVLHLWSLNARPPLRTTPRTLDEDEVTGAGGLLHIAQALSASRWGDRPPKLWAVTRGAHLIGTEGRVAPTAGELWGLGRSISGESSGEWGGLVDLDPAASSPACARQLVDELLAGTGENQVAFRDGQRYVARLRPRRDLTREGPVALESHATYLITGGLGALGLEVARWMVAEGARNIVMLQRTPLPAREEWKALDPQSAEAAKVAAVNELESTGAQVTTYSGDVADAADVTRILDDIHERMPPLKGIVHAAGLPDWSGLSEIDLEGLRRITAPKVRGAWNLHTATLGDPLEFFVMFSSASAILDSPLLGTYAAANAGLDSIAHYRFSEQLPALSINWGPWSDVGMAVSQSAVAHMGPIAPDQGVRLLGRLLNQRRVPQLAALPLKLGTLASTKAGRAPVFSELTGQSVEAPKGPPAAPVVQPDAALAPAGILQQLRQAGPDGRAEVLEEYLKARTAEVLELHPSEVDLGQPLTRMGVDSLMAVELRNHVEGDLDIVVDLVAFLDGASLRDLAARWLDDQLGPGFDNNGSAGGDRYSRAIRHVEHLSDEEVDVLLAQGRTERP